MGRLSCKILTLGRHKFVLINHRLRCKWCGELRSRMVKKNLIRKYKEQTPAKAIAEPIPQNTEADQIQHP
jgi:hypothetical protein